MLDEAKKEELEAIVDREADENQDTQSNIDKEGLEDTVNAEAKKENFFEKAFVFLNRNCNNIARVAGVAALATFVYLDLAPNPEPDTLEHSRRMFYGFREVLSTWTGRFSYIFLSWFVNNLVIGLTCPFTIDSIKLKFNYKKSKTLLSQAVLHNDKKEYVQAADLFRKVAEIIPHYSIIHYNIGNINNKLGRLYDAVEPYKKAIKVHRIRESKDTHIFKTRLKYFKEDKDLIEQNPNKVGPYLDLAVLYYIKGNNKKAKRFFEKILEVGGEIPEVKDLYNFFYETARVRKR